MNCHLIPRDDERLHHRSTDCWCAPRVDVIDPDTGTPWASGGARVVHNAADCREIVEQVTGEGYGGWSLFIGDTEDGA
jgi:hypothetical protein